MGRNWKSEAEKHAFFLSKKVDEAIRDFDMISEGDRILVGVSGGKDSMSLLNLLTYRLKHSPEKYEIVAAHVRGDARGAEIDVPQPFLDWLVSQGVEARVADLVVSPGEQLPMNCERCSRARRRTLFEIAEASGCNKVALGHNLEDFAATALMNLFSAGNMETMEFKRVYFRGRFTLIRPLAYVREKDLFRFAKVCEFPIVPAECPWASTSKRAAALELMSQVARHFRHAPDNIVRACANVGK
jgi:tRNA 2-thiocytidine biosynthesis protein TtcA